MKSERPLTPYVGMPVTYCIGSDRYAYEIVKATLSLKTVWIKSTDKNDIRIVKFTLRNDGYYTETGKNCGFLRLGYAEDYRDPSF
jgi:hypothetical protein